MFIINTYKLHSSPSNLQDRLKPILNDMQNKSEFPV
jgi:hypothetical protein